MMNSTPFVLSSRAVASTSVTPQSEVQLPAGLKLIAKLKQHDPRIGAWNAEFQPALLFVERLIGEQAEAQYFCVKGERPILISHGNAHKFDSSDHFQLLTSSLSTVRMEFASRYC
jgi:hypothetical protein